MKDKKFEKMLEIQGKIDKLCEALRGLSYDYFNGGDRFVIGVRPRLRKIERLRDQQRKIYGLAFGDKLSAIGLAKFIKEVTK